MRLLRDDDHIEANFLNRIKRERARSSLNFEWRASRLV
jgi:hypothetical protein